MNIFRALSWSTNIWFFFSIFLEHGRFYSFVVNIVDFLFFMIIVNATFFLNPGVWCDWRHILTDRACFWRSNWFWGTLTPCWLMFISLAFSSFTLGMDVNGSFRSDFCTTLFIPARYATPICFVVINLRFEESLASMNQVHSFVCGYKFWTNGIFCSK